MFNLFGSTSRKELYDYLETTASCNSWYGHTFQKLSETSIFCPTCGKIRKIKET